MDIRKESGNIVIRARGRGDASFVITFSPADMLNLGWMGKTRVSIESMEERQPIYTGIRGVLALDKVHLPP